MWEYILLCTYTYKYIIYIRYIYVHTDFSDDATLKFFKNAVTELYATCWQHTILIFL